MQKPFSNLVIIGVGLIGSSIARATRQAHNDTRISVIDHHVEHLQQAEQLKLAHEYASDYSAVRRADLVILATPSGCFAGIARAIQHLLPKGCIVSDTSSVKMQVLRDLSPLIPDEVHLIPAHPVAGTEHSGPKAGSAGLFNNRYCLITPPESADRQAVERLLAFWKSLGALPELMEAAHHDRVLAMTSHLPHFISFAAVHTAAHLEKNLRDEQVDDVISQTEVMKYSAGGFRDLTRVAHAEPAMWRDVFLYNRDAVLEMLARFQSDLNSLAAFTARSDGAAIEQWVRDSRHIRLTIQELGQAGKMLYNESDIEE